MHVIPKKNYTLDATAGTITLSSPYDDLDLEQFITVVDLDTNHVIYDVHLKRDGVTFASGVLTYTADNNITNDDDDIRIVINDTSGTTQAIGGYSTTLDALKIVEQAPLDQQVLDPNPVLNAVTTAQSSTAIYTLDKKSVTLGVSVSSLTSGATIKVEASNTGDTGDWGAIGTVDNVGNVEKERVFGTGDLTENGAYFFEIVNAQRVKYMRVTLESVIDGTYTAYLTGGAI